MTITIPAAEFKRRMSEFLGRVLFRKDTLIITRRGKPVAQVAPVSEAAAHLGHAAGWLDDSDPFFEIMDGIVADRDKHQPRGWTPR